jgi:hypothetical protein
MTKSYHLCLDVRGCLANWSNRDLAGIFTTDDGKRRLSADEAKQALMDEIAAGHAVIPYGPCNNFDYQQGCMGHPEGMVDILELESYMSIQEPGN